MSAACEAGQLGAFRTLVEAGADLTIANANGYRPIHFASRGGNSDIFTGVCDFCSLEVDGDHARWWMLTAVTHDGRSPLSLACEMGNLHFARVLVNLTGSPDDWEYDASLLQTSPIVLALRGGHIDIVRTLIAHGATVPDVDKVMGAEAGVARNVLRVLFSEFAGMARSALYKADALAREKTAAAERCRPLLDDGAAAAREETMVSLASTD